MLVNFDYVNFLNWFVLLFLRCKKIRNYLNIILVNYFKYYDSDIYFKFC